MNSDAVGLILADLENKLWSDIDPAGHFPEFSPKLAHYTSLFTAEAIIKNDEFWMSHPFLMNDHEELRWGLLHGTEKFLNSPEILKAAATEAAYRTVMKAMSDAREADWVTSSADTYLACFSLHEPGDTDGRLSMWRAYGSDGGGVALVFDTRKLVESEESPLIIAPVQYRTTGERFAWMEVAIQRSAEAIQALGSSPDSRALEEVARIYFKRIRRAALFSKHKSFDEEQEWRIVYDPDLDKAGRYKSLLSYAITPKGIQPKLKLKLGAGAVGSPLHLEDVIESILLGPTAGSLIARNAMMRLCEAAGKPRLSSKVRLSSTPYRS